MKGSIGLAKAIRLCCEHDGNNDRLEQVTDEDRQSRGEELDKSRALLVALISTTSTGAHKATQFQYNVIPFMHSASASRSVWSLAACKKT